MRFDIPKNGFIGWECATCGKCVSSNLDDGLPSSKYWDLERQEVYCCAQHGLDRHEELRTNGS